MGALPGEGGGLLSIKKVANGLWTPVLHFGISPLLKLYQVVPFLINFPNFHRKSALLFVFQGTIQHHTGHTSQNFPLK